MGINSDDPQCRWVLSLLCTLVPARRYAVLAVKARAPRPRPSELRPTKAGVVAIRLPAPARSICEMLATARTAQAAKMRDRKRAEAMLAKALAEFGATGGGRPASAIYRLLQLALHVLNAFWHWLRQLMLPTHEWLQFARFRLH